jgi:hypothetical protein
MVADELLLEQLHDDYGDEWFFGRTRDDEGRPNWWKAKRKRDLSDVELDRGLAMTLIYDTAPLLREALAVQTDLEGRVAAALNLTHL